MFHLFKKKQHKYTLNYFERVNTSEWQQSGSKKGNKLVKYMNRAPGSVSATRAEWQYGEQRFHCHQPVIDIQSPAQLAYQDRANQGLLCACSEDTFNQMAIT